MLLINYFSFLRQLADSASNHQKYPAYIFFQDSYIEGISSVNRLWLPQEEKHVKHVLFLFIFPFIILNTKTKILNGS